MKQITIHPTGPMTPIGREYVAVCDGKIVTGHFCSNDSFAKCDLGLYAPENSMASSVAFARKKRELYSQLFPEGFEVRFSEEIFRGKI